MKAEFPRLSSPEEFIENQSNAAGLVQRIRLSSQDLVAVLDDQALKDTISKIADESNTYIDSYDAMVAGGLSGIEATNKMAEAADALTQVSLAISDRGQDSLTITTRESTTLIIGGVLAALLLAGGMGFPALFPFPEMGKFRNMQILGLRYSRIPSPFK